MAWGSGKEYIPLVVGFAQQAGKGEWSAMDSSELSGGAGVPSALVDWSELSGLDQIVSIYALSESSIVVRTHDARDIRITAWRNLSNGEYVADFERRSTIRSGAKELTVWAQTPAYQRVTAEDMQSCLEAAVTAVDRIHVY